MTILRGFGTKSYLAALLLVMLVNDLTLQAQNKSSKYACSEPNPASLCTAANTCGSGSQPCSVDVKRTNSGATATPEIAGAKGNSTFCVKAGTTVIWKSDTKHQGFVIDTGPSSPFGVDDIIGGSDRSVTVVARTPGCYKFTAGACISGEIYGMCGNGTSKLIIMK